MMQSQEFRAIQGELDLSAKTLAVLFEVQPATISRWRKGVFAIPGAVGVALRLMKAIKDKGRDFNEYLA
jgi:DNA-binding transcriptional regulator YiaG